MISSLSLRQSNFSEIINLTAPTVSLPNPAPSEPQQHISRLITKRLRQLAAESPRTDDELIGMTQGRSPDVSDLALGVWHERSGQHADGCDVCDVKRVERLSEQALARHDALAAVEA